MAVNGRFLSGSDLDAYEKALKQSYNSGGLRTEIESGTEAPAVLMPGSPLLKTATENKKNAEDLLLKKEDAQFSKIDVNSSKIKVDRTKKEYEDYVKSDEYRKRLAENDRKNKQQEVTNLFLPPEMRQQPKVIQDDKEIRLRAAMEQAEQEFKAAEDRKLMEADMEAVTGLSNEDRQQLEQYAVNQIRDQNLPVEFQNMPFFKTAEQEAAGLIDKVGKQRADELAETYMRDQNAQFAEDVAAKGAENAGTGFWQGAGASAATIPINLVAGLVGSVGQLQGAARNTGRYNTLDPNATGTALQTYTGAVRGQVQQNIEGENPNFWRKAASIGYQGLMSAADSLAQAYLGGAVGGAALAATNSFSQTMAEASANGATPGEAALLATATAGIEALSEKIPLDNLLDTAKGGKQTLMQAIGNVLKQAGIEATTEEISLLGTVLAEAAILKGNSSYQRSITAKILSGIAPEQAKMEALREILEEAKNTALVSMVSGAGSSAVSTVAANNQLFAQEQAMNNPALNKPGKKDTAQATESPAQTTQAQPVTATETVTQTTTAKPAMAAQTAQEAQTAQPQQTEIQQQSQKKLEVSDIVAAITGKARDTGTVSNKDATQILSDPQAVATLEQESGRTIEGSNSEKRAIVKEIVKNLSQQNTAQEVAQQPQTEAVDNVQTVEAPQAQQEVQGQNVTQEAQQVRVQGGDTQVEAENVSAAGIQQQIKGTGAAEQNFTGKPAYNATLSEDNAQPDRRNDVRPMELPSTDVNGGNISAVTGNVYGASVTPDEFASLMEEPTARGDFSYVPISNNEATQQAMEHITRYGWQDAYTQWSNAVHQGRAGAEMSARGALFLNHAAQAGDRQQWLNILSDFQRLGTNTAQGLQAFRILRNLAPSDRLYMMRRSVDQMVRDMHLNVPIEIDQQLAYQYQNAQTNEEADAILDEIIDDVAAQIPSTAADRWTALRYVNMLGNMRTQARNISGNIGAKFIYLVKDQIGAALEKVVHAFNPDFQRTKSSFVSNELKDLGRVDFDEVRDIVLENGRFDDARRFDSTHFAREVNERRRIFRSGFMESYRRLTNWAMNNDRFGDAGFARSAYARAFGGYLKANGFNGETLEGIDQNLLDDARLYAIQQAQESTFRDHNAVSDWVGRIGRRQDTPRVIRTLSEGVMPFRSTPANVLVRAEEFSPLGIINTAVTAARAANPNSDITGTDVVESMAKTLTGTGLFIMGAYLGKMGMLAGGPDPDEEQAEFDKMNGYQNYALQLGDGKNITIDFLSPLAVPMFLGAELEKIISDGGYDLADFEKVFTSLADPLIQMSMLQGLNDTLDSIKYSENNLGQFFLNASMSYLTQGITNTLMGQLERSSEENRMTTYVNKDSSVPQWMQQQLGKMSQKIPGWDYQQSEYLNAWGETQKNEGGLTYNLLSPGYISTERSDPITKELNRLREATGENVFPDTASKTITYTDKRGTVHKDYNLTEEQYQTYAQTQGQTAKSILESMISSKNYGAMTDDQRAKAMQQVYSYAREKAMQKAFPDHLGYSESWMQELREGKEAEYILRRVTNSELNRTMSNLDTAWDNKYSNGVTESYSRELETAYDSYSKMTAAQKRQVKEFATGNAAKYIEAREKGISHDDFISTAKNVNDVKGTGKNGTVRDIDRRQAIAKTTGLTMAEVDKLMRVYMPDYDMTDESPETTEFKYQYIREELDLSPAEYASTYRAYLDGEKKAGKIADIMKLGYDWKTANALYKVYNGSMKQKLIAMYG